MRCFQSLARDDLPDRGCASLGGHMGGKDDVERWTSLYKGFTRPGRGKKLPEPDDATLRRLRDGGRSRAAPVSIAPPAPTANRREQRPSAGHVTPAADPPPPPPPPQPSSANANDDAPAPASDVQPRRRRRNKAELAEAQAAAKREAVRVAVRHAMGGALAEDPHLRRLEAAAKLEAEVERARAMAMGAGRARTTARPPIRGTDRPTRASSPTNRPRGGRNPRTRRRRAPASPRLAPAPVAHVGAARRLPHGPPTRQARARAPARIKNVRSRRPLPSGGTGSSAGSSRTSPKPRAACASPWARAGWCARRGSGRRATWRGAWTGRRETRPGT